MNFQTILYLRASGKIVSILPSKYIRSKHEKLRLCPGYAHEDLNFLYFPSKLPVDPARDCVRFVSPSHPPIVINEAGLPLIYMAKKLPFLQAREQFKKIIVNFHDSMGDHLYRAAAVMEAQKQYPDLRFFCKIDPAYHDIMAMIPEITIFQDYKAHALDPKECGTVSMAPHDLADPLGIFYSAPSRYGLFLGLDSVPYSVKLTIPPGGIASLDDFAGRIGIRDDGRNVVMQLRTKNEESRSWVPAQILELARLIKEYYDCTIFYLGLPLDFSTPCTDLVNLTGKTTWMETVFLLRQASHVFCIDSSVLHLCHALDIEPYRLWGRTHPRGVLGEAPGPRDIGCSEPPHPENIKAITAIDVFERAFPEFRNDGKLIYEVSKNTSQQGEQEIIFKYFSEHPPANRRLVDVGAYGVDMSNSFALLELGWKGLLLEASPDRCEIIKRDFAGLDFTLLNVGAGSAVGRLTFYLHTVPGHNSFLPDWYPQTLTDQTIKVGVVPLKTALLENEIPPDFDLLSIDTEGMDEKIMKKLLSNSVYRPALIVTESTSYEDAEALYSRYGYSLLARTGTPEYGNLIFSRNE